VLNALPPGVYTLTVEKTGFSKASRKGVVVNVQAHQQAHFSLQLGEVTETIQITDAIPTLERDTSSVGQVVDNKTVLTLPLNSRNYSALAVLTPGVTPNPGSRTADAFRSTAIAFFSTITSSTASTTTIICWERPPPGQRRPSARRSTPSRSSAWKQRISAPSSATPRGR
jgi:hypothetical protein